MHRSRRRLILLFATFAFGLTLLVVQAQESALLPGTDQQAMDAVERDAERCRTAAEAVALYETFLAQPSLPTGVKAAARARLAQWKESADKGLVRLGKKWVTPEERQQATDEADQLIERALELIAVRNYPEVRLLLQRASSADPDGIRADFLLGMLNTPLVANHAPTAKRHFATALLRQPGHISLLNNLALTEVRNRNYGVAVAHWEEALKRASKLPEVTHNLGRLIREAQLRKLNVAPSVVKRASSLYAEALTAGRGEASERAVGWLYMPLYLDADEKERTKQQAHGESINIGSGTGFVVHPGYLLTNRHVVEGGETFKVLDPADGKTELEATVVARSEELDLALLSCKNLQAPPLVLHAEFPRRGMDVMLLGYPQSDLLGDSLKSTRGAITGFQGKNQERVLYDAVTNAGNSGGPVSDQSGTVVAVHFAGIGSALLGANSGKYGCGIPSPHALAFLQQHLPDVVPGAGGAPLEWPDVDAAVSPSVAMIRIYSPTIQVNLATPGRQWALEDRSCNACGGSAVATCPARGCLTGRVGSKESYNVVLGAGTTTRIQTRTRTVYSPCGNCRGTGKVDCPHCVRGLDPSLGGR